MSDKKTILLVGGAGYIGSHTTMLLKSRSEFNVIVFDNLSTGHRSTVVNDILYQADLADKNAIRTCLTKYAVDLVIHFASSICVGESVVDPEKYYINNVSNTLNLLSAMRECNVNNIIFSSTAAVYGLPTQTPIPVDHTIKPINPYGHSKAMVEQIIKDFSIAYNLNYTFLRYFNAAGADPSGLIGEQHEPETHLIPLVLQTAAGKRSQINIYGSDYDTLDGTCIRDYIHVCDIASAHLLAAQQLISQGGAATFNLGLGKGYSVKEIIETAKKVTSKNITTAYENRRSGDPAVLVADPSKAKIELKWRPQYSSLSDIITHAWRWQNNQTKFNSHQQTEKDQIQ